jgi:ATP-dependent phosphofructokinase / diphosphate-dependent phosphofructokinase
MRFGLLTGGGDSPGLNAAIRAIVRHGHAARGATLIGFAYGWRGVLDNDATELTIDDVRGILPRGGTVLGTSGVQPHRVDGGVERVRETLAVHRLDGVIVLGGEGTIGEAARLGVPVIGIPKTIDNDVRGTDASIGFHTAAQVATDLVDRLYSTAESHHRVMVCEVMGRHAGWIGLTAGVAAGADVILLPEHPFDVEAVCRRIREVVALRRSFAIVVVSEGAAPIEGSLALPEYPLDANGFPRLGGIGSVVADEIRRRTGFETRVTVLGHVQRGGSPVAFDRVLATRMGRAAVDEAFAGGWNRMMGLRADRIEPIALDEIGGARQVPPERWRIPEVLCE